MKILKIFMVLCCVLFSAQSVSAQKVMIFEADDGHVNVVYGPAVKYGVTKPRENWVIIDPVRPSIVSFETVEVNFDIALNPKEDVKSISLVDYEMGVCYSLDNPIPTIDDKVQSVGRSFFGTHKVEFERGTKDLSRFIYVRAYLKIPGHVFYGEAVGIAPPKW